MSGLRELRKPGALHYAANAISLLGLTAPVFLFISYSPSLFIQIAAFALLCDDSDGVVARLTSSASRFGMLLDILSDAFSHSVLALLAGASHGKAAVASSIPLIASTAIRLTNSAHGEKKPQGTTTNEHVLTLIVIVALEIHSQRDLTAVLIAFSLLAATLQLLPKRVVTIRRVSQDLGPFVLISLDLSLFLLPFSSLFSYLLATVHLSLLCIPIFQVGQLAIRRLFPSATR